MSIFDGNIFGSPRRGVHGLGALGILPSGAVPIASVAALRATFPGIPSDAGLVGKGASHYTVRVLEPMSMEMTFYDSTGRVVVGPIPVWHVDAERPVEPGPKSDDDVMARRGSDGLLPSAPAKSGAAPGWLSWLLVGGGVLVAGGIVYASTRRTAVAANRRRRRRRRRR